MSELPEDLLQWVEGIARGDLSADFGVGDPAARRLVEALRGIQTRWSSEREETLLELARGVRQATELHEREMHLQRERERMRRELDEVARQEAEARAEAQIERASRMASIGTLAAGVGHEINNPLTNVIANLDYIAIHVRAVAKESVDPRALSDLAVVVAEARDGAERIRRIIGDLKLFSRADEEDRKGPVDVHEVLDAALSLVKNEIHHRARVVKEYGHVPQVAANESRLAQVFVNLLVNAAHAIPVGRASENQIRVKTEQDEQDRAVVEIRDTGAGIPPENLARVFEPFFTTKSAQQGTGLGLSICHGIITSIGGEISAESAVGTGSTFRVAVPVSGAASPAAAKSSGGATVPTKARILIIDDEPLVAKAMARILSEHNVRIACGGQKGLALLGTSEFDVVLCDLMMPDITGMDVYRRVREVHPAMAERFVFITGGAFTPQARSFLEEVENPRVHKPFTTEVLTGLVHELVTSRRNRGAADPRH